MFWVFFATKVEDSSFISQKTAIWFYRCKIQCFKLHITDNMFCFVNNSIGLPWALYCKKSVFAFFAVKLCCCQRYCTGKRFSSSLQRVTLIFTSLYFVACVWLSDAVFSIIFLRTTFPLFSLPKHFWRSILPKECFGLLATQLSCFEPYDAKKRFSLSVFKIRCV